MGGSHSLEPSPEAAQALCFAGLILDFEACRLTRDYGEAIPLTRGELALLRVLVTRPGRVISRESLLDDFTTGVSSLSRSAWTRSSASCVERLGIPPPSILD